jgi:flagellar hook-associated protein 1 FlgK
MSIAAIFNSANSGLQTAQAQLRTVSDNIANVNTPGYARKVLNQTSVNYGGQSAGVSAGVVTRAVDRFLVQAGLNASAAASNAGIQADMLDRAQALFGDPSADNGYFNQLDQAFSAFNAASQDPASSVTRNQALNALTGFLDQSAAISTELQRLSGEATSRISDNVAQVNSILKQVDALNSVVIRVTANGGDATDAENNQDQLLNTLSQILDISVTRRDDGAVDIRSGEGALLLGRGGPATLSFASTGPTAGDVMVASSGGSATQLRPSDGLLKGLMDIRNVELPNIAEQLGEYVTRAVDEINRAHNAAAAVPAPNQLTGRDTGLDLPTAIQGFSGKTTISVVDGSNILQTRVDIDFDTGTMSVDGGPATAFTPATFLGDLNAALGANGSASFSNGALSLQASAGAGVAIADDPSAPSSKAGRGFSHFFGLNDLVTSTGMPYPATGLTGTDSNGFNAGGTMSLRVLDASGVTVRDITVPIPTGTVDDFINALNSPATGVGLYGSYSLDSQGRLTFTSNIPGGSVRVLGDTTQRGAGGPSASDLFVMDAADRARRAATFQVRPDIAADSSKLSVAKLDLSATAGLAALAPGDGRGVLALGAAGQSVASFDPAGAFGAMQATLADYGAQFAGQVAGAASTAAHNKDSADALAGEAESRRASVEGVNLDEELIKLTTYQQSYNASARIIQAVREMYDALMQM